MIFFQNSFFEIIALTTSFAIISHCSIVLSYSINPVFYAMISSQLITAKGMNSMILNTILISSLKILDNFIGTTKSILVHKNKAVAASILIILSQFLFYFVISKVISENSIIVIIAVSIASGVGSFFAFKINDRFSKDKLYLNIITSKHEEDMRELCEFLRVNNIKNIVTDSYRKDWTKSYAVQVFAITRVESILIDKFLKDEEHKYFREILY